MCVGGCEIVRPTAHVAMKIQEATNGRGLVFISVIRGFPEPLQHIEVNGNFSFRKPPIQY